MPHFTLIFFMGLFVGNGALQAAKLYATGATSAAVGGNSVTLANSWSALNNPACLARITDHIAGLNYQNSFLLKALQSTNIGLSLPVKNACLGIAVSRHGYALFRENDFNLSYGMIMGETFSAGIQLQAHQLRLGENYGQQIVFTGSLGILADLSPRLTLGAYAYNVNNAQLATFNDERQPNLQRLGLQYKISGLVQAFGELEKEVRGATSTHWGINYQARSVLHLRSGIRTGPMAYSFGFGCFSKNLQIDVAFCVSSPLGYESFLSIQYILKSHEK